MEDTGPILYTTRPLALTDIIMDMKLSFYVFDVGTGPQWLTNVDLLGTCCSYQIFNVLKLF